MLKQTFFHQFSGQLTLVDWKTISAESEKTGSAAPKTADDLYDNPLQLAAYLSALNASPAYSTIPQVRRAAVVLCFEDGRGVQLVTMEADEIEVSCRRDPNKNLMVKSCFESSHSCQIILLFV